MKYDSPAPSKFGKDLPLWKSATTNLLQVVKECGLQIQRLDDRACALKHDHSVTLTRNTEISTDRVEGIWRQIVDSFRGGILADW